MLIDLSRDEIQIVRAILLGAPVKLDALSAEVRQRLVLKLHAALEGMPPEGLDEED